MKALDDGEVLNFSKAFFTNGAFFMLMAPSHLAKRSNTAGHSNDALRAYRRDRTDEFGRDVYKNVTASERAKIDSTAIVWESKNERVHGQAIALPFVTEIDLDGKYYVVFKHTVDTLGFFNARLETVEHAVPAAKAEAETTHAALLKRLRDVDTRLDQITSELNSKAAASDADANTNAKLREQAQALAALEIKLDSTDRKYQALPPAVTSHAQKLVDIEDELRKLERLHAAKNSRARGSMTRRATSSTEC